VAGREKSPLLAAATKQQLVTSEKQTENFAWAVVVVIYGVCKITETFIIICSYKLQASNKSIYQFKPHV
jgi:hypothetical protein